MATSFSGTAAKRAEGSLTIYDPPIPLAGMSQPPLASMDGREFQLYAGEGKP